MDPWIARFTRTAWRQRLPRLFMCSVWLIFACTYAWLAWDAHRACSIALPRAGFRIDAHRNFRSGVVRFQDVIDHLAEQYDRAAFEIEKTVRTFGRTSFVLNLTAAFLSFLAFGVQLFGIRMTRESSANLRPNLHSSFENRRISSVQNRPICTHEGCFPDAGYGH
jgi:hypothetical protein